MYVYKQLKMEIADFNAFCSGFWCFFWVFCLFVCFLGLFFGTEQEMLNSDLQRYTFLGLLRPLVMQNTKNWLRNIL